MPSAAATGEKRYRGALAVCALLIAWVTVYPLDTLRMPTEATVAAVFRPRYLVGFDILVNVLAYVPLGLLAALHFRARNGRPILGAVIVAAALSGVLEVFQLFIPYRVASAFDVLANVLGAWIGALFFSDALYPLVTQPVGELRERLFIEGNWGDAGLMLVALWLLAQLNPALPFFGAGDIVEGSENHGAASVLQWVAVGLALCGFSLFISAIIRGGQGALRTTVVLLSLALWLKFVTGSFMLKPHFSAEWVSGARVIALTGGLLAFVPLRRVARLARIYLAILLLLAGALLAKIFGAYSALAELLRIFSWPHGQLANFATLTRFLHEVWPFVAIAYLIGLFFHTRRIEE